VSRTSQPSGQPARYHPAEGLSYLDFGTGRSSNGGSEAVSGRSEHHRRTTRRLRNRDSHRLRMQLIIGGLAHLHIGQEEPRRPASRKLQDPTQSRQAILTFRADRDEPDWIGPEGGRVDLHFPDGVWAAWPMIAGQRWRGHCRPHGRGRCSASGRDRRYRWHDTADPAWLSAAPIPRRCSEHSS
jgi:hypothetical protein